MYCTTCNNGTNAESVECLTHWQSVASGDPKNSATTGKQRVHILRCSSEHSRQDRQGDWAGSRRAGNRESRPRVLREFLRQVNGYLTLPVYLTLTICPSPSKHLPHVHELAIRSALASCRLMRCLGGCQSITLCFRLTLCVRRAHDMTHPLYAPSLNSCQIAVANPLFYSVSALLITPFIENDASLNPCTSLLFFILCHFPLVSTLCICILLPVARHNS